jgi:hypothetical protein
MKKELGLVLIALFFLSLNTLSAVYALDEDGKEIVLIEDKEDVSGDGKEDSIILKGIPYEEGASYLKEIFLQIKGSNGKSDQVELEGGYEPDVTFVDLDHDGIEDMLISIPAGGSGGMTNYSLFTYKDFQLKNITPPDPLTITSQFLDRYQASITIENTGQSYNFDLKNRKKDYDRLGIYQNGRLNEPRELMVDPFSTLKPVKLMENSYGLKAIQSISGAYHADGIAFIESTWNYENGKWNLLDTKVMERKQRVKKN